jgi:hypothetical protein
MHKLTVSWQHSSYRPNNGDYLSTTYFDEANFLNNGLGLSCGFYAMMDHVYSSHQTASKEEAVVETVEAVTEHRGGGDDDEKRTSD